MAFGIFANLFRKEKKLKVPSALVRIDILDNTIDLDLLKSRIRHLIDKKETYFVSLTGRDIASMVSKDIKVEAKVWPEDELDNKSPSARYIIFIDVSYVHEYTYTEKVGGLIEMRTASYNSGFALYTVIPSPPKHLRKKYTVFNIE